MLFSLLSDLVRDLDLDLDLSVIVVEILKLELVRYPLELLELILLKNVVFVESEILC